MRASSLLQVMPETTSRSIPEIFADNHGTVPRLLKDDLTCTGTLVFFGELDRSDLEHFGAQTRHFEHLFITDFFDLAGFSAG